MSPPETTTQHRVAPCPRASARPRPFTQRSVSRRLDIRVRCDTGTTLICMPTKRRRHAITETPPVQAALDELRQELGEDGVELGELVVLGAGVRLEAIRSERIGAVANRRRLAERVRSRTTGADVAAADEVRSSGWTRG